MCVRTFLLPSRVVRAQVASSPSSLDLNVRGEKSAVGVLRRPLEPLSLTEACCFYSVCALTCHCHAACPKQHCSTRSRGTLKGRVLQSHINFEPNEPNIAAFAWKSCVETLWVAEVPLEILRRTNVPWETDFLRHPMLKTVCFLLKQCPNKHENLPRILFSY